MITLEEAYEIIKVRATKPITAMLETEDFFMGSADECVLVNKATGEIGTVRVKNYWTDSIDIGKEVYYPKMYDNLEAYSNIQCKEEHELADYYAQAYRSLQYAQEAALNEFKSAADRQGIIERWSVGRGCFTERSEK